MSLVPKLTVPKSRKPLHSFQPRTANGTIFRIACAFLATGLFAAVPLSRAAAQSRPVFASDSFWYKPIPSNATLNTNSANYAKEFLRQYQANYGTVGINATSYSSPVYAAGSSVKPQAVIPWNCQNSASIDPNLAKQWTAVPIPAGAKPAAGTDHEMTIWQPSTDQMWEFWNARQTSTGSWQACWGGGMQGVSHNPGIWTHPYGAAATGLPFSPGQVTIAELKAGVINHVIGIALVDTEKASIFSWPANRSDGTNPTNAPNRIPEGLRFRFDPTVNVNALNIHPIAKIILKAAQTYGFVVWDKSGAISLRFENPTPIMQTGAPNPYTALFNGTPSYSIMAGVPWNRLQFMPMNYGKP